MGQQQPHVAALLAAERPSPLQHTDVASPPTLVVPTTASAHLAAAEPAARLSKGKAQKGKEGSASTKAKTHKRVKPPTAPSATARGGVYHHLRGYHTVTTETALALNSAALKVRSSHAPPRTSLPAVHTTPHIVRER